MATTNRTLTGVVIMGAVFSDMVLAAAGAETWPAGAVLARNSSTGKMVRLDPDGTNGTNAAKAVLTQAVTFAAAGDRKERPLVAGQVRASTLVDDADAAITAVAVEQLRDYGIIAQTARQLSAQDNQ